MTAEQLERYITQFEHVYFTGPYGEETITKDLQNRQASDRLSTLGSNPRQTYLVSEKKKVYFEHFDKLEEDLKLGLGMLQKSYPNHALIPRFERCQNQVAKLRNLVQNF